MAHSPSPLTSFPPRWTPVKVLGTGFCGDVVLCRDAQLHQDVAIKSLRRDLYESHELPFPPAELELLSIVSHPNLCALLDVHWSFSVILLIMAVVRGEELFEIIQQQGFLDEQRANRYMEHTCNALAYLHRHSIAHRDIMPENVVISHVSDSAVLVDLGLAVHHRYGELLHDFCGSKQYAAPEVKALQPYLGAPADMWSIGVLYFEMLTGLLPFEGDQLEILWPDDVVVGPRSARIIRTLLQRRPEHRCTAVEVRTWIAGVGERKSSWPQCVSQHPLHLRPGARDTRRARSGSSPAFFQPDPRPRKVSAPELHAETSNLGMDTKSLPEIDSGQAD